MNTFSIIIGDHVSSNAFWASTLGLPISWNKYFGYSIYIFFLLLLSLEVPGGAGQK